MPLLSSHEIPRHNPRFSLGQTAIGVLFSLTYSSFALASDTRLQTLAYPQATEDESYVFDYPGQVSRWNIALLELGTASSTSAYGGALKTLGAASYGLVVSRDQSLLTSPGGSDIAASAVGDYSLVNAWLRRTASTTDTNGLYPAPERPIDLFFGMGDKYSGWGLRATLASYLKKTDTTPTSTTDDAQQLDVGFGYSSLGSNRLDFGVQLGLLGDLSHRSEDATTKASSSFKRNLSTVLNGRYIARQNNTTSTVFKVGLRDRRPEVKTESGNVSKSGTFQEDAIDLQGGFQLEPTPQANVSVGLAAFYLSSKGPVISKNGVGTGAVADQSITSTEEKATTSAYGVLANVGVEAKVYEPIGILAGFSYPLWGRLSQEDKTQTPNTKSERSLPDLPDAAFWRLGFFVKTDRARVDASYGVSFLHNGPYLAAGNVTKPMLAQISGSYLL